ncbi:hypothetical protein BU23DRAFT_484103, partial [Bimuria novae-zelandiae CBS 107.79]
EWNYLMGPRMWRDFTTTLQGKFAEDFQKLSEERQACFQDIRTLAAGGNRVRTDYDALFSSFMHLLRDDQLLELNSAKETPLDSKQLLSLLRHQSNLRTFRARLDFSDIDTHDAGPWMAEQTPLFSLALRLLKSLRIYIGEQSTKGGQLTEGERREVTHTCEMTCSGLFLKAAPLLDCLEICGWRQTWPDRVDRIPLTTLYRNDVMPEQFPRTLSCLLLADMDLSGAEDKLIGSIDFTALRTLKLEYCDKVTSFLYTVAASITKMGTQLKVLTVRTRKDEISGDEGDTEDAVKDLLCSFSGLEELEIDFLAILFLDWETCLSAHGTLKKLHVSCPRWANGSSTWNPTIARILGLCPNVQSFGSVIRLQYPGYVMDCQVPFPMYPGLYKVLDTISAAPSICTLRILNNIGFRENEANREDRNWIEKVGQIAHHFATVILTHLHSKGSNIRLLALSPNLRWKQSRGDSNLQYYPHYFFRLKLVDVDGRNVIEVAPLRDYVAECPDAAIFV